MRIAILSDIHANGFALDTVLKRAEQERVDTYWFLGDAVGYGPHPVEALEFLRELPVDQWVPGNHDAGLFDKLKIINGKALEALEINRKILLQKRPDLYAWFRESWPETDFWVREHNEGSNTYTLVHGSFWPGMGRNENLTYYLYGWRHKDVIPNLKQLVNMSDLSVSRACLFAGHTHIPTFCHFSNSANGSGCVIHPGIRWDEPMPVPDHPTLINPGSVGQPRDGDPRASFAILDTDDAKHDVSITFHRVDYPVRNTRRDMSHLGFHNFLRRRLEDATRPHDWPEGWVV